MTPTHDSANAPTAGVSPLESLKLVVSLVAVLFGASLFYGNHLDGAVSSSVIAEVMDSPNECLKSAVKNDLTKHQDAPITRRNLGEHAVQPQRPGKGGGQCAARGHVHPCSPLILRHPLEPRKTFHEKSFDQD